MSSVRIEIDRLAFGGNGVGRVDGKVCFVPCSCPGDELDVRIVSSKRSYSMASIAKIIHPSASRVEPRCSLFGRCGGCNWQHVDYDLQLKEKRAIFADTLWRGARIDAGFVGDIEPSLLCYGYRSRVQFKLHYAGERMHIGFYRQGTHFVEDAPDGCAIALPVINSALESLRAVLADFPEKKMLPQINIDSADGSVVAVVNYIGGNIAETATFFEKHRDCLLPLTGLYLQTGRKHTLQRVYGDSLMTYALPAGDGTPCRLSYRPGGFSQVNATQNIRLLELVRTLARFSGNEQLLDLYCGNGNFSLPLAGEVAAVTGVEEYAGSIEAAVENAAANSIDNALFICDDAVAAVERLADEGRRFDVVLLDPPRSGAAEAMPGIVRLDPERIVYISCDPSTLARDCAVLTGTGGYRVLRSIPVDMFPQTYHLESVTLLQKIDKKAVEKYI